MAGTAVTQKSPMLLRRANKVQTTGAKEAARGVVPEEAVTKDVEEEADTSTLQHKNHLLENSREKWKFLAQS